MTNKQEFKSFRNAAIVIAGLTTLAPATIIGWEAHVVIARLRDEYQTAIGALSISQATHKAMDDERHVELVRRVDNHEERIGALEQRPVIVTPDALPWERRRRGGGG